MIYLTTSKMYPTYTKRLKMPRSTLVLAIFYDFFVSPWVNGVYGMSTIMVISDANTE